jgi:hypothetical protein
MRTRHTVAQLVTTEQSRRRIEEATGEPAPVFRDRSLEELRERDIASLRSVATASRAMSSKSVARSSTTNRGVD